MTIDSDFAAVYARAREGREEDRSRLALRFQARLAVFIERGLGPQLRSRQEPADVAQSVMARFFAGLSGFPADLAEDEVLAYLLQIAKRTLADSGRRLQPAARPLPDSMPETLEATGVVTREDDRAWARERIAELPPAYGDVMRLHYVEGRDLEAIAFELGIDRNLVKQRLFRGRRLLRESVDRRRKEKPT